jgi:three-Cys-motif partner protein
MSKFNRRLVYIDAFAGPGVYTGGEPGSPIIVIKSAMDHCVKINFELVCLLIENNPKRCESLKTKIAKLNPPENIKIKIELGDANQILDNLLTQIEKENKGLAPTFAFIDPFNFDVSFDLIKRLFNNKKCEIFILFPCLGIIRSIPFENQSKEIDRFFGTDEWSKACEFEPDKKRKFLHDLYMGKLRSLERKSIMSDTLVRSFEMINMTNNTSYFLFYVTKNDLGLEKMKEAMWKVDKRGIFQFSDNTDPNQTVLFTLDKTNILENQIKKGFKGKQVRVEEIEEFVIKNTAFLATDYKSILTKMEKTTPPKIEVISSPRKTNRGYPKGTIIKFL